MKMNQTIQPMIQPIKSGRLESLDVFRGLTIAAMLLVNNAGDWSRIWGPLGHAEWNGCTSTDLIFPFFLFIMGVAMQFSFAGRLTKEGGKKALIGQVIRRTLLLTLLNTILAIFIWKSYLGHYRFYGVLQRIALCYFFASFIMLYFGIRGQIMFFFMLMAVYYIIIKFISAPGEIAGSIERFKSILDYVDTKLFGGFNYQLEEKLIDGKKVLLGHDPEGLISTLTAISTTLAGAICGYWLRLKDKTNFEKVAGMSVIGMLIVIVAKLMKHDIPFNKNLWTPSYVLYTAGAALLCLSVCYWLIDIKGYKKWSKPFLYYGTNAITAYFGASMMALVVVTMRWKVDSANTFFELFYYTFYPAILALMCAVACYFLLTIKESWSESQKYLIYGITLIVIALCLVLMVRWNIDVDPQIKFIRLKTYIYSNYYKSWIPGIFGDYACSAAFGSSYVILWCFLMWLLHRRKIFIKI